MNKTCKEIDSLYDKMVGDMKRTSIDCSTECLSPTAKKWVPHDSGVGGDQSLPLNDSLNNSICVNCSETNEPNSTGNQFEAADNRKENIIEIAGTLIHLENNEVVGVDDDEMDEDFENMDFDPNATYSIKTMNPKKLDAFLKILNESEDDISVDKIKDLSKPCCSLPTQQRQSTPNHKIRPLFDRSDRLGSERSRRH